jgi:hypothetical protein
MEGTSLGEDRAALTACVPVVRRLVGRVHQAGSDDGLLAAAVVV